MAAQATGLEMVDAAALPERWCWCSPRARGDDGADALLPGVDRAAARARRARRAGGRADAACFRRQESTALGYLDRPAARAEGGRPLARPTSFVHTEGGLAFRRARGLCLVRIKAAGSTWSSWKRRSAPGASPLECGRPAVRARPRRRPAQDGLFSLRSSARRPTRGAGNGAPTRRCAAAAPAACANARLPPARSHVHWLSKHAEQALRCEQASNACVAALRVSSPVQSGLERSGHERPPSPSRRHNPRRLASALPPAPARSAERRRPRCSHGYRRDLRHCGRGRC